MGISSRVGAMVSEQEDTKRLERLSRALKPVQETLALPTLLALIEIGKSPGMSVNELAERIGSPQQTASRHAAILLGRYQTSTATNAPRPMPLIAQEVKADDPRSRALFLTTDGKALIRTLLKTLFA